MEGLIDDDDEEVGDRQSFSPSQPMLLSQKADLLQDARKKNNAQAKDQGSSCDIEDMLSE